MFNVVLVEPEIPPNTGNIGRLCLATRSTLHLVRPLGFSTDDRTLKRAGLDYWAEVDLRLLGFVRRTAGGAGCPARFFYLTTKTSRPYHAIAFPAGRFPRLRPRNERSPGSRSCARMPIDLLTIPMHGTRSLNLATAVAIVLFEAVRQQA